MMHTRENPPNRPTPSITDVSRREFIKTSAVAVSATALAGGCATGGKSRTTMAIRPGGIAPEKLRVGLIGCGGRGTGAAKNCAAVDAHVEIVAMGDLFQDHLDASRESLAELGDQYNVADEDCFVGFDAYRGVLACDVDLVILATPPGFRPAHLAAAIDADKHVFMEKPVAVDPVGVRSVIESSERADRKGLAIVAGTQRCHQPHYLEVVDRIHRGKLGDVLAAQCYWNQGELWVKAQQPEWSDMEWQCRNWLYFTWLSGDHIVEQHVHNLDVVNWAIGSTPVSCVASGGRQARTAPEFGNIYDHFAVEYEYPGGVRVMSMCRQIKGASGRVAERIVGTKGVVDISSSHARITGRRSWAYDDGGAPVNPYEQEHRDLLASIRRGRPLNEGKRIAESTLTAIMGRMSAYTGREVSWNWVMNASKLDLTPPHYEMTELPVAPVAIPGETALV